MSVAPTLVWFQQDLRLADNPALAAAVARGGPVIPVYVWAPEDEGKWPPAAASRWWLDRSLRALSAELERRGSRLIVRRGPAESVLLELLAESGARAVYWNRRWEPAAVARERRIAARFENHNEGPIKYPIEEQIDARSFSGNLLFEPGTILNGSGEAYRVFSAFWKACVARAIAPACGDAPWKLRAPESWPRSLVMAELGLAPQVNWAGGLADSWEPGEAGAGRQLEHFASSAMREYGSGRERPDVEGTSRLSPHLHFGEISPGAVWRAVGALGDAADARGDVYGAEACAAYLRQLGWREFGYQLLFHFPASAERALRPEFAAFPWRNDAKALRSWQRGKTGYPLVDAGMRELWHTGWMHNRVRMVVASFLVKHLLIGWQAGAEWFWETLVDADLANNTLGWQWVAGCGADAAPYFRIFNPVVQGEKFDAAGEYVRRWVPELAGLPERWIHEPWKAPSAVLAKAGVVLGENYPRPIVEHEEARRRALAAFAELRAERSRH